MNEHQTIAYHLDRYGRYILDRPLVYYSPRYRKYVTCPVGMASDGASGPAEDIASLGWWVHDRLCDSLKWDDGTPTTPLQRSTVLHDILLAEGRWFRARSWWLATGLWDLWCQLWR